MSLDRARRARALAVALLTTLLTAAVAPHPGACRAWAAEAPAAGAPVPAPARPGVLPQTDALLGPPGQAAAAPGQLAASPDQAPEADRGRLGVVREALRLWFHDEAEQAWQARTGGGPPARHGDATLWEKGTIDFVRSRAEATMAPAERRPLRLLELELVALSAGAAGAGSVADTSSAVAGRIAELGYQDYVQFAQAYRGVFLPPLMRDAMAFVRQTNPAYARLLGEASLAVLNKPAEKLSLAEYDRLEASDDLAAFFPAELAAPAFREYLGGLGLSLTDLNGRPLLEDRTEGRGEAPRVFAVEVPTDVRLRAPARAGLPAFRACFREAGRALALARTTETSLEYQRLGGATVREGLALLFQAAWTDVGWLKRYREFVRLQNGQRGTHWPLMTETDIARVVRRGAFLDLVEFRRGAQARLIVECIAHEAPRDYVIPFYAEAGTDVREAWRTMLGFALGTVLKPGEIGAMAGALTPLFASADQARGWVLMPTLAAGLARQFGPDWSAKPAAGQLLVDELMAPGTRLTPLEAAGVVGFDKFNFDPLVDRVEALAAADKP